VGVIALLGLGAVLNGCGRAEETSSPAPGQGPNMVAPPPVPPGTPVPAGARQPGGQPAGGGGQTSPPGPAAAQPGR